MTREHEQDEFLTRLIDEGFFIPLGSPGLFGRSSSFEDLVKGLEDFITTTTGEKDILFFPPVMPREILEKSGFMDSMPHLAGIVHCFCGQERDIPQLRAKLVNGEDWGEYLSMTDLSHAPAACYPLYPTCTGRLPPEGRLAALSSTCFRHEPSPDPTRMQSFRMRELVRLDTSERVLAWRDSWIDRAIDFLEKLGLSPERELASDPFFGRPGRVMASSQRERELKFELVVKVYENGPPLAVMSLNYHEDHFGKQFDIQTADGQTAHSACMGFGLERIVLSLLNKHGYSLDSWPEDVLRLLNFRQ
jgi:seryl-tRNA synthetase